ncbi:unnamed protein product, partial [marine sediment metagenome]
IKTNNPFPFPSDELNAIFKGDTMKQSGIFIEINLGTVFPDSTPIEYF